MVNKRKYDVLAVTDCNVNKVNRGSVFATANVTLNDQLLITGIQIINTAIGPKVEFPKHGKKYAVIPLSRDTREHIENCVLEMWNYRNEMKIK